MIRRGRTGLTLAEVLVAGGLFLLILGFFVPVFRICWRSWSRGEDLQATQRATLSLTSRLRHDFANSLPESLRVEKSASNTLLSFISFDASAGQQTMWTEKGEIIWRKWVQYKFDASDQTVRRREVALTPPTEEPSASPPAWDIRTSHPVARNVSRFDLDSASGQVRLHVYVLANQGGAESATDISVLPAVYALDTVGY
ncbi:hypothetical protein IV102_15935 [bacterium]|nr:hypothetical protein [bacterium]